MAREELEKDEEMAEEYVRNKADKGNFDIEQFGKAYFSESSVKQAYLAGLKAGRPQWHNLIIKIRSKLCLRKIK